MEMMLLENCCDILDSMRVPITAKDRKKGPYPYYGANGVQDYVADYIFDDELVLLAEDGGNFGSEERPIAYKVSGKCWVNNHAHVLKPKAGIDVDYLCYSLMFYRVDGMVNGATRMKLTQAAMRKMLIPSRDIEEQKKIVRILNKVQMLIKKEKEQIERYDELIKSRFVEVFGDPISNPMGWEKKPFLDIGNCKNGMNFHYNDTGIEINCLGVGDFKDLDCINDAGKLPTVSLNEMPSEEYLLKDGDIVFVRSNGNKALVGRSLVVYPGDVTTTFSGFCIRYRKTDDAISIPYLLRVLKTDSMRQKMAGRGANIQNLNQQILGTLEIPVPPNELQEQFAAFVHQIDKLKVEAQGNLEKAQLLFDSLMQQYFG